MSLDASTGFATGVGTLIAISIFARCAVWNINMSLDTHPYFTTGLGTDVAVIIGTRRAVGHEDMKRITGTGSVTTWSRTFAWIATRQAIWQDMILFAHAGFATGLGADVLIRVVTGCAVGYQDMEWIADPGSIASRSRTFPRRAAGQAVRRHMILNAGTGFATGLGTDVLIRVGTRSAVLDIRIRASNEDGVRSDGCCLSTHWTIRRSRLALVVPGYGCLIWNTRQKGVPGQDWKGRLEIDVGARSR